LARQYVTDKGRSEEHQVAGRRGSPLLAAVAFVSACAPAPPSPLATLVRDCDRTTFDPPATLVCEDGIDAVIAALFLDHGAVVRAEFTYALPCSPLGATCPFAGSGDRGFVILSMAAGQLELVHVERHADGGISVSPPEPYTPPT
jgi:hypothetical protein